MSRISKQITIGAPVGKVWGVLADFGGVSRWAPTVLSSYCTTQAKSGVGARRRCEIVGSEGVEEEVVEWHDGRSLTIALENAGPIKSAVSEFCVASVEGETVVTQTTDFLIKFGPAGAVVDRLAARRQLGRSMASLLAGLKHYVETGEAVTADTVLAELTEVT